MILKGDYRDSQGAIHSLRLRQEIGAFDHLEFQIPESIGAGGLEQPVVALEFQDEALQGVVAPENWSSDMLNGGGSSSQAHLCETNTIAMPGSGSPDDSFGSIAVICAGPK